MSFGASSTLRFDQDRGGLKNPVIFWEKQQNNAAAGRNVNKNKFKPKGKDQKFPLRSKDSDVTDSRVPESRSRAGKTKKPQPALSHHKPKNPTPKTAGTVVLTQKEFDTILETIGTLALEADDAKLGKFENILDHTTTNKSDITKTKRTTPPIPSYDKPTEYSDKPPAEPHVPTNSVPVVAPTSIPGLELSSDTPQITTKTPVPASVPSQQATDKPSGDLRRSLVGVPTAHLTKAEKKRLEWERERAESAKVEAWSPWGQPGSGAPMKDAQGKVITDRRKAPDRSPNSVTNPATVTVPLPPTTTVFPPTTTVSSPKPSSIFPTPQPSERPAQEQNRQPPPAAIRSSFVVGNPAPNEDRFESAKERQRREWLEALEQQREEQRQRRTSEKEHHKTQDLPDTWADRFSAPTPKQTVSDHHVPPAEPASEHQRVVSAPAANVPPTTSPSEPTSHIRGQNIHIDPQTLQELEMKRQKQLEHQEYIRAQIEEKERLKAAERDRRRAEEQAEEDRLRAEQRQLQNQIQMEKDKHRQKEDEERQRLESLRLAMEEAQEIAAQEKHQKQLRKLQQAGHDVSQLHANFNARITPRSEANPSTTGHYDKPGPEQVVRVEPSYVPGLDPTPRNQPSQQDLYLANQSPRREESVQTEPQHIIPEPISQESTGIEYTSPIHEKKQKVRVISAPTEVDPPRKSPHYQVQEERVKRKPRKPEKISERRGWGQPNPKKKSVKQSERDPFHLQRQREKEMRRLERQEAMLRMANENCPKVSTVTTAASQARARSRSRDRNEAQSRPRSQKDAPLDTHHTEHRSRKSSLYGYDYDTHARTNPSPLRKTPLQHEHLTPSPRALPSSGSHSPPIPALKHRKPASDHDTSSAPHSKYQDQSPVNAPNGQFVPFIRSSNVLDPAHAESPIPLSREPSMMDRARKAYLQERNPGKFGYHMENFKENEQRDVGQQVPLKPSWPADPIMNPGLVTEHPSGRQNQILQQLSDLRRGLLQKRKEWESDPADIDPGMD